MEFWQFCVYVGVVCCGLGQIGKSVKAERAKNTATHPGADKSKGKKKGHTKKKHAKDG